MLQDTKSLSKFLKSDQPVFADPAKMKKTQDQMDQQAQKDVDFLMTYLVKSVTNQLPDFEGKGSDSQVQNMTSLVTTMSTVSSGIRTSEALTKVANSMQSSAMADSVPFIGKTVYVDDSTRNFNGKDPVEFAFQVDSTKEHSFIKADIKILDESGKVVCTDQIQCNAPANRWSWSGKDKRNNISTPGKYRILVDAKALDAKTGVWSKIKTDTDVKGNVASVLAEHDEIKLVLQNGKVVELSQITRTADENSVEKPKDKPSTDIVQYIGRDVSIDLSKCSVNQGKGEIVFANALGSEGPIRVDLFDSDGQYVKSVSHSAPIQRGINKIALDAKKEGIKDSTYTYKVLIQNPDGEFHQASSAHVISVAAVDVVNNTVSSADGISYNANLITKVSGGTPMSSADQTLAIQAASYVGKQVEFEDSTFEYTSGATMDFDVQLPMLNGDETIDSVSVNIYEGMNIYKGNALVATVVQNGDRSVVPILNGVAVGPAVSKVQWNGILGNGSGIAHSGVYSHKTSIIINTPTGQRNVELPAPRKSVGLVNASSVKDGEITLAVTGGCSLPLSQVLAVKG